MTRTSSLWLSRAVLATLSEEADRMVPSETGGVLLGYTTDADDVVVTDTIGPGPDAVHERCRFVPDHAYQLREIERLYQASGRLLRYLGDWHTHPGGTAELSGTDLAALRSIAAERDARVPRPVMLVLAEGPAWQLAAWRGSMTKRWGVRRRLVTTPLAVRVFDRGDSGEAGV